MALDHAVPGKNRMNSLFSDVLDIHEYTTIDIRQTATRITREKICCLHFMNSLSYQKLGIFYKYHFIDITVHTTAFMTPVVKHWLE